MISSVYKRAASLLICFAFVLSVTFVRPQKADAIAITGTAAVVASVAAIMTACGVTYWANSQQDAIDYLGGKIDDYLDTLGNNITYDEWLGISGVNALFTVISNGVLSFGTTVANKILLFVRWFNQEEGVTSGGSAVGNLGTADILYYGWNGIAGNVAVSTSSNSFVIPALNKQYYGGSGKAGFLIPASNFNSGLWMDYVAGGSSPFVRYFTSPSNTGYQASYNFIYIVALDSNYNEKSTLTINLGQSLTGRANLAWRDDYAYYLLWYPTFSNYPYTSAYTLSLTFEEYLSADKAIITPSSSVSVPSDLGLGQSLVVTTTAPISNTDDVEAASEAILQQIASQDGLDATNITDGQSVPSESIWLWDVISSLPARIANAIKSVLLDVFVPDQAFIDEFFTNLASIFDNRFSILSYPFSLLGIFITKVATIGNSEPIISWPNIYEYFSGRLLIAAGSYNLNNILANQAIANMYAICMIVIKAIISFQFVAFLYAWFCDVFHMRNSDFDNPYDLAHGGDIDDS